MRCELMIFLFFLAALPCSWYCFHSHPLSLDSNFEQQIDQTTNSIAMRSIWIPIDWVEKRMEGGQKLVRFM